MKVPPTKPQRVLLLKVLLLLLGASLLQAHPDEHRGLLFPPNNGALGSKGQFVIPSSGTVAIDGAFSISFELSIWDPSVFGYLLTVLDPSGFVARLTYFPRPFDADSADIFLSVNHEPTTVSIALATAAVRRGRWFPLELSCNPVRGTVSLRFAGRLVGEELAALNVRMSPAFVFGHTLRAVEAPPMALRNISIATAPKGSGGGSIVHTWPLEEKEGETVLDRIGGLEASQLNCIWLASWSRQWILESRIPVDALDPVVFDAAGSRILIAGKHRLTELSLIDSRVSRVEYRSPRPLRNDQVKGVYHSGVGRLLVYHNGTGEVSAFDDSGRAWSTIDTAAARDQHYYDHATFADPRGDGLYAMGGYGWFTAKNTVQQYAFAERRWISLPLRGSEKVPPRYFAAVGPGDSSHHWYVFGGYGNSTGRQEAGYHALRDLWLLDLERRTWSRKFDTINVEEDFFPQWITRTGAGDDLLILGGFTRADTSARWVVALSPDSGTVRTVAALPSGTDNLSIPLFSFDVRGGQLILGVIRWETPTLSALEVYTHLYPPAPPIETPSWAGLTSSDLKQILLALALTATLVFALWVYRRRHPSPNWARAGSGAGRGGSLLIEKPGVVLPEKPRTTHAAEIRLFGRFRLTDAKRKDRTSEFSPKILELFLLIATHSNAEPSRNEGIAVQKLTAVLWPHSTKESAKNSRGVALKALRDLLGEIGGLRIVRRADHLALELDPEVSLDLFTARRLAAALEASEPSPTTEAHVAELLGILDQGILLETFHYPWLDPLRTSLGRDVSEALQRVLSPLASSVNSTLLQRVADRVLATDPLNESAFRVKLRGLAARGRHGEAADLYASFASRYAEVYRRPFQGSIRDFLN